eukprot:TRINITY_DN67017_c0_g1_i1.p1 TRINITY_DN67017_c0_g1~~TRINITY_DN67017_c0_g1_i1.p1  ORF type:complete len:363 (-),score=53.80 TRINITY_DN67017_c0_g1_i1:47-1114(-)
MAHVPTLVFLCSCFIFVGSCMRIESSDGAPNRPLKTYVVPSDTVQECILNAAAVFESNFNVAMQVQVVLNRAQTEDEVDLKKASVTNLPSFLMHVWKERERFNDVVMKQVWHDSVTAFFEMGDKEFEETAKFLTDIDSYLTEMNFSYEAHSSNCEDTDEVCSQLVQSMLFAESGQKKDETLTLVKLLFMGYPLNPNNTDDNTVDFPVPDGLDVSIGHDRDLSIVVGSTRKTFGVGSFAFSMGGKRYGIRAEADSNKLQEDVKRISDGVGNTSGLVGLVCTTLIVGAFLVPLTGGASVAVAAAAAGKMAATVATTGLAMGVVSMGPELSKMGFQHTDVTSMLKYYRGHCKTFSETN